MTLQTAMKKAVRQQRACLVHWDICLLMLSACGSLERRLLEYLKLLSPWQQLQLEQLEALKLNANLRESLSEMAKLCIDYLKVAKLQPPPWDKIFNVAKVCLSVCQSPWDILPKLFLVYSARSRELEYAFGKITLAISAGIPHCLDGE